MSVAWSTINPVLIQLFTDIAVDQVQTLDPPDLEKEPLWSAEWGDRGQATLLHPGTRQALNLRVISCTKLGQDATTYEYDDDPDVNALIATQTGNRKFTLQVQSIVTEAQDDLWCMETLERIRTRLQRPSSLAALLDVEVSLIEIMPSVQFSMRQDAKQFSAGNMDIVFGAAVNDTDSVPVGWIERIQLTSHFKQSAADELEVPPNVEDDWIPDAPPDP